MISESEGNPMKRIDLFPIFTALMVILMLLLNSCQSAFTQTPKAETPPAALSTPQTYELVNVMLKNIHLQVSASGLARSFPAGCTGQPPACNLAGLDKNLLIVEFNPTDLPQGDMLPYKEIPQGVGVRDNTGAISVVAYKSYNLTTRTLTLAFEVAKTADSLSLIWPGMDDIPLHPVQQEN